MLLNRWMDAILYCFGGRDEQNSGISARRDFGVAAGSRPSGRRLVHQNLAEQNYSYFGHHGRQNNVKSLPSMHQVASVGQLLLLPKENFSWVIISIVYNIFLNEPLFYIFSQVLQFFKSYDFKRTVEKSANDTGQENEVITQTFKKRGI